MPRKKWTGYLDEHLIGCIKSRAAALVRSEAFIVEMGLGEAFNDLLPPGWKAGAKNEPSDSTTE